MPSWKKVITSGSDAALNSLNITTSLTASGLIYPTVDGLSNQVILTDGNGNLSFSNIEYTSISIKNVSGGTITKGTPCYITGSGTSGNVAGVWPADASNPLRMPAGVIAGETLNNGDEGIGLINGFINGVNTSAFAAGDSVYVAVGGGYTNVRPTGSAVLVQKLGNVEKSAINGSGVINGPGYYNDLPNVQSGYIWVGNSNGVATAIATSSIQNVVSASFATSASWAPGGGATFPYTGSAEITGSLGVTGSFSVLDSIDATNKILIGSGPIPGSTEDSVNWDSRTLFDSNGNFSMRWGTLRSLYDANASQSADWNNRLLKFDNGPGDYTVNWNAGILRDTGSNNSVDWQNRITIDTGNKTSIDWQNRQLKDSSGNETLNWQSGVKITGSLTVSGSLVVTGSLLITGSSTLINQGPTILSGSFKVQGEGDGFGGPITTAITVDDINFTRKLHDSQTGSGSLDFANRDLLDANGNGAFNWNGVAATIDSRLYINQTVSAAVRDKLLTNVGTAGQLLNDVAFDSTVQINDLVYLGNDGSWYQVDQATDSSTRMLGICMSYDPMTYIGQVLLEGDVIVSTGPGYPSVAGAGYGTPVYIKEGAGTAMSTTVPVNDYVRLLGYCYHEAGGTEWIMKFRPSNEWVQL
jgi:hypothetical protein